MVRIDTGHFAGNAMITLLPAVQKISTFEVSRTFEMGGSLRSAYVSASYVCNENRAFEAGDKSSRKSTDILRRQSGVNKRDKKDWYPSL